jgi:OmpA-OmpF porin, OOP family
MLKGLLITTALVMAASAAQANDNWYVGVAGGANWNHSDELTGTGFDDDVDYDWGGAVLGTVGYHYGNGLRSELELGYRENDLDEIANGAATGDVSAASAMLNVLYDFDISDTAIDTYVGIGGGAVRLDYEDAAPTGGSRIDDTDTVPAAQAIVGASYNLSPATDLFANYQYLHTFSPEFRNDAGVKTETDFAASTVLVGVKFKLGGEEAAAATPVAAPMVAPAPAPSPISRDYLVFFDFDKTDITPEAMTVLKQAAADAKAGNAVSLSVVGHADRSGTESYNQRLSEARAAKVKETLAGLGIDLNTVQTAAKGETDPLVPTADGVREPQNRRAQVQFMVEPQK